MEVMDSKGQKNPGKTIHEIVVELQRAAHVTRLSCSFFSSWECKGFQDVLDGEMKSLACSYYITS